MFYPKCFESRKKYERWMGLFSRYEIQRGNHLSCQYCTTEFKEKMVRDGECSYPGVAFVYSSLSEGMVGKVYKNQKRKEEAIERSAEHERERG